MGKVWAQQEEQLIWLERGHQSCKVEARTPLVLARKLYLAHRGKALLGNCEQLNKFLKMLIFKHPQSFPFICLPIDLGYFVIEGIQFFFFFFTVLYQPVLHRSSDSWAVEQCVKLCESTYFEPLPSFRLSLVSSSRSAPPVLNSPEWIANWKPVAHVCPASVFSLAGFFFFFFYWKRLFNKLPTLKLGIANLNFLVS